MSDGSGYAIDYFYANRNKKQYKLTINGEYIDTYTDISKCLYVLAHIACPAEESFKAAYHLTKIYKLNEDFDVGESGNVVIVNIQEVN